MIKFLIERPIAVIMAFTAFFIMGVITYLNVPISLLPDIAIPDITVQISGGNQSARELENNVVTPVRQQLMQVGKLRDIRTETRDGNATIHLKFDYGANTDLAFIEVNEKIDASMGRLPRDTERPGVIKASVTDIPVLNINLTYKNDKDFEQIDTDKFLELSEFAQTVIKRRIEQLPQVAMVDATGLMHKQVVITPNKQLMDVGGVNLGDVEHALQQNNVDPGSMVIRDGIYEYSVRFSTVLRTVEDIGNIYIRKHDRIYQLKDLATVELLPQKQSGMAMFGGKRAIVLSVIKQSSENMGNMQRALNDVISNLRKDYPQIEFNVSQNQTELLDYTISNLKQNLLLAFIFICLVSVIFLRDARSPFIIGASMFISLIITLLFFYLCKVSLNVISLTGLILALGMMIDNSIIVTDNIGQYRKMGLPIKQACIKGTNEVIAPMLSSSLTTISVFLPLIFLSGIAGALFFDQAFSVAVGLLVSYVIGIMLLPVFYILLYSVKLPRWTQRLFQKRDEEEQTTSFAQRMYSAGIDWVFSHKLLTFIIMIAVFPICVGLMRLIPKEKMPDINQKELVVSIDWNENIHIDDNYLRCVSLVQAINEQVPEISTFVGQQQFLLNRDQQMTTSESEMFLNARVYDDIPAIKKNIEQWIKKDYPLAIVTFAPLGTVFEKIFSTGEPDLVLEYYANKRGNAIDADSIRNIAKHIEQISGEAPQSLAFDNQLNITIDRQKLLQYNVSYDVIMKTLRTAFKDNIVATLRSYQQYMPIMLSGEQQTVYDILNETLIDGPDNCRLPLSEFITITQTQDLKTITSSSVGEYLPFVFYEPANPDKIIEQVSKDVSQNPDWEVFFSGNIFTNKNMIKEMMVILFISLMLMYFILAAQFENFTQPLIVLLEIPIDIAAALGLLYVTGHTLNLMSAIGIIVTCGIVINDSILKVDIMNQLRKSGVPIMEAIHQAGCRRLNAILMTSLTTIVCMTPLLFSSDLGSELEKPLAIATIGGMVIGTIVSLMVVPLAYWWIYRKSEKTIQ